ncbi:MAG: cytochrome c oxidase subunit 3 [Rhodocyclaceae bacterium]
MSETVEKYFVPAPSHYPIFGSVALLFLGLGAAMWMNKIDAGPGVVAVGAAILIYMLFGWFGQVIRESQSGKYGKQVDRAFRWSMGWFIFSEVMFFGAFFGVLFYVRVISVPDLGTELQHLFWPGYEATWPTAGPYHSAEFEPMGWFGLPLINTLLLVTSAVTLTVAHWGIKKNKRGQTNLFLALTIALGLVFLACQAFEYQHAYAEGLKLTTGVYGSTFFMMTGFHGLHVTIGAIMLIVMLVRSMRGHFTAEHHFGFEAAAWYWHFVDYVWLLLFAVVYVL